VFQSVACTLVPIAVSLTLVWVVPPCNKHPFELADTSQVRRADYKLVTSALYSEDVFKQSGDAFWKALTRIAHRQGRFIVWYYLLIILEGCLCGKLSISYFSLKSYRWYRWTASHVFLPSISEWHLLLTGFYFEDKDTIVRADILCSDRTLYRGRVWQHFLTKEGQLSSLIVTEAKRYARDDYVKDKEKGKVDKSLYWHDIPGSKFLILANQIVNLNLSYEPTPKAMEEVQEVLSRELNQAINLVIEDKKPVKPDSQPAGDDHV